MMTKKMTARMTVLVIVSAVALGTMAMVTGSKVSISYGKAHLTIESGVER